MFWKKGWTFSKSLTVVLITHQCGYLSACLSLHVFWPFQLSIHLDLTTGILFYPNIMN